MAIDLNVLFPTYGQGITGLLANTFAPNSKAAKRFQRARELTLTLPEAERELLAKRAAGYERELGTAAKHARADMIRARASMKQVKETAAKQAKADMIRARAAMKQAEGAVGPAAKQAEADMIRARAAMMQAEGTRAQQGTQNALAKRGLDLQQAGQLESLLGDYTQTDLKTGRRSLTPEGRAIAKEIFRLYGIPLAEPQPEAEDPALQAFRDAMERMNMEDAEKPWLVQNPAAVLYDLGRSLPAQLSPQQPAVDWAEWLSRQNQPTLDSLQYPLFEDTGSLLDYPRYKQLK